MNPAHSTSLSVVGGLGGGAAPLPPNQKNAVPRTADSQYRERMTAR
jgi:hypothetical protein